MICLGAYLNCVLFEVVDAYGETAGNVLIQQVLSNAEIKHKKYIYTVA